MYRWLIKKIAKDNTLTDEEFSRRCANVMAFWALEGQKYNRVLEKISKEDKDDLSFDNVFLSVGYWFRFKLLCEGQEPTFKNVVLNGLDCYALKLFINEINGMMDE